MNNKKEIKTLGDEFAELLEQLNPPQREAVNTIEGPVLTIAGPGTGKTHILTARIGQILRQTDAQPHNILCLTFTDAGVLAMRQRLIDFIGHAAHRVHIYTFHSFCNKVIQENLDVFGYHDLEPLSDLERIYIIRELLDSLDVEHPLRAHRRDLYHYEPHLRDLFRRMKSENWSTEYIHEVIDRFLEDLPNQAAYLYQRNTRQYKRGDLKQAKVDEMTKRMDRLRSAADLFENYKQLLHQRRRYDYEDMLLWVLQAFEEQEHLLRLYQEQYLYVLVDEFQDTNGAQSRILHKLIEYWEHRPNIFIVGDDDQSIYEFQGARVRNMIEFYERYRKTMTVVLLNENYRSEQKILDVAKTVIDHNQLRIIHELDFEADKQLIAANLTRPHQPSVKIVEYPNKAQEEIDLVLQIQELTKNGVPLNEIAIIYARHRQANNLIALLEKNKIAYRTKRRINILELPVIQHLSRLMQYIVVEYERPYSGEEHLFELLHYPFLGIHPNDVAALSSFLAKDTRKKYANQDYDNMLQWRDVLHNKNILEELSLRDAAALNRFVDFLDGMQLVLVSKRLPDFFELLINRSGLITYIAQHEQKAWYIQVINTFFEFIKRESLKQPDLTVNDLLNILDGMQANKLGLGIFKTTYAEQGVNLVTAHSSKGLEFQYVFMLNCCKEFWEPASDFRGRRFSFPNTLTHSSDDDAMESARRLFYVAMTRAKYQLQIGYYTINEKNKTQQRACFVDEVLEEEALEVEQKIVEDQLLLDQQLKLLTAQQLPKMRLLDSDTLDFLLEDFRMSVSALNTYINCPLSFYYEYILRLPSLPSEEASYGTAIHYVLKRVFDLVEKYDSGKLPHIDEISYLFKQEMERQRLFFDIDAFDRSLELGGRHLPVYIEQRKALWNQELAHATIWTERPFKNVEIEGVPVTGVIDKIIINNEKGAKSVQVIDYKTGKLKSRRLKGPSEKDAFGGNYWRQLVFYKMLFESANIVPHRVKSGMIDYLTPDEKGIFPQKILAITTKDVQLFKSILHQTYKKIQLHEFDTGCGKRGCKWCAFALRNIPPDSFNNEEAEMMDE